MDSTAPIFEVKSFGVTLDLDRNLGRAESCFNSAEASGYGQVVLYKLDPGTGLKTALRVK